MQLIDPTAVEVTETMLKGFGKFLLRKRVPNMVDGLKDVWRIVIGVLGTSDKERKVSIATGKVMISHPHGDSSISEVISELTKEFSNIIPLVKTTRNNGSYTEPKGESAPRYLLVSHHPFVADVYINSAIPKALKYRLAAAGEGDEPVNYVPLIPMAMLVNAMTIGVGFKTDIIPKGLNEVCDLAIEYVNRQKRGDIDNMNYPTRLLLPDSPIPGMLLNSRDLMEEYRGMHYDATIITCGNMEVSPDTITIRQLSMNVPIMKYTVDLFRELKKQKDPIFKKIGIVESFDDKKTKTIEGEVIIPLNKGVSPFEVMEFIKKKILFKSRYTPISLYINGEGLGVNATPMRLLREWYNARRYVVTVELKYKQDTLVRKLREYKAVLVMKDNADDIFKQFKNSKVWEDTIPYLKKTYDLTSMQTKYLSNYTMKRLSQVERAKLEEDLLMTEQALLKHRESVNNIDDMIIEGVTKIKNKWGKTYPRKLKIPKFYGYLLFRDGVIKCWDKHELKMLSKRFHKKEHFIIPYHKKNVSEYYFCGSGLVDNTKLDLEKEFACEQYILMDKPATRCLELIDGNYKKRPLSCANRDTILVSEQYISIDKNGAVVLRDFNNRSGLWSGDQLVCNNVVDEYIVTYVDSNKTNIFTFMRMRIGDKVKLPLMGGVTYIDISPADRPVVFDVPEKMFKRVPKTWFMIDPNTLTNITTDVKVRSL